ncbi:MAG: cell division protein FtsA [Bdellovibrionales bacterium]|nr:cell division protein FtsA [Bdellovibrionales bacterium]
MSNKKSHIIASLDIGTSKVAVVIGELNRDGLKIIGFGRAENFGVRQGAVINIEATSQAIQKAKMDAELMAGQPIKSVWVSVSGNHVKSFDSSGMVAVKNYEVAAEDISRVIDVAKAVAIPADREMIHVLPKDYTIDGQEGISDPLGMTGVRLEANVHIVTANKSALQNTMKCVEKAELSVNGIVLQQLASSLAVLSAEERKLGCCVIDIGGGTSDMIVYSNGSVIATDVVPIGGINFVQDVAVGLKTTQVAAEKLIKEHGAALTELATDESIEVESVGGRQSRTISEIDLCKIIEARAEETIEIFKDQLNKYRTQLGSGVVLTGGVVNLNGIVEMCDYLLDLPVRRGWPKKVSGLKEVLNSSEYSTSVGLLIFGIEKIKSKTSVESKSFMDRSSQWARVVKDFFGEAF